MRGRSVLTLWSLIYCLGDLFSPYRAATEYSGLYTYILLIGFFFCFDCLFGLRLFFGFFCFFLHRKLLVVWGNYDFAKKYFWGVTETITWALLCSSWCLVLLGCLSFNFCSNSCSPVASLPLSMDSKQQNHAWWERERVWQHTGL